MRRRRLTIDNVGRQSDHARLKIDADGGLGITVTGEHGEERKIADDGCFPDPFVADDQKF